MEARADCQNPLRTRVHCLYSRDTLHAGSGDVHRPRPMSLLSLARSREIEVKKLDEAILEEALIYNLSPDPIQWPQPGPIIGRKA